VNGKWEYKEKMDSLEDGQKWIADQIPKNAPTSV
jgi:hypothetical protein